VNDGAVARRHGGEPVRRLHTHGARHVARDDGGLARDMAADVTGEQPRAQVIVATRSGRDHHADRLATIEIGNRLSPCG